MFEGIEDIFKSKTFKESFWKWFNSLSYHERKKFYYYHSDMAELFYYNQIYKKGNI